jgi:hypothetical protein
VIVQVPEVVQDGLARAKLIDGAGIAARGFVLGGKVSAVRGVVLRANERIPAVPPARAVSAKLIPGRRHGQPGTTLFEFSPDLRARTNRMLPVKKIGPNNRLVVWAEFQGFEGAVLANVCLQVDVQRPPTAPTEGDGHTVSSPHGGVTLGRVPVPPKVKIYSDSNGGYFLGSCILAKMPSSSAITAIRAKIFSSLPTTPVDAKTIAQPFAEWTASGTSASGVGGYTFDGSTQRVPGARVGKGNFLFVWAKFASGTDFQLPVDLNHIQFEGMP